MSTFLTGLGRKMHSATVRVLYAKLTVEDDDELLCSANATETQVGAVLCNPEKYGPYVKQLVVRDAGCLDAARPASAGNMRHLLALLSRLEGLSWHSAFLPPDGLCEVRFFPSPLLKTLMQYRCYLAAILGWRALNIDPPVHIHARNGMRRRCRCSRRCLLQLSDFRHCLRLGLERSFGSSTVRARCAGWMSSRWISFGWTMRCVGRWQRRWVACGD